MTLQNLCLHTIAENFEQYFTVFSTTKDAKIKRKFEFLQRVYSYEFASLLYEEYEIEEKYIDFLINAYLKILDTNWFVNCVWKTVVAKMMEFGPNITKIYFSQYSEETPWDEIFCYLPNLETLHFHRGCVDEILRSIAKFCPNILEVDLRSSCCITEEGFKSLCEVNDGKAPCQKLKSLFVECCDVTEEVAQCLLKNLPSLEVCDYRLLPRALYSMHCQDLLQLDKIKPYNIVKLNFIPSIYNSNTNFGDILKVCVTLCPYATSVTSPVLKPEHLDTISELKYLSVLHLENYQDNFLDLNNFVKLKGNKLTSITIKKCSLSVLTLAESVPLLKHLVMLSVNLESHPGAIPLFHNLEAFTIEMTIFGSNESNLKAVCSVLSSSPNLECITFKGCNLSSSEMRRVILKCCELNSLNKIDFGHSSVDKPFIMDILLTCHSLKTFNLHNCDFDSDDEEEIFKCAEILPNCPEVYFSEQLNFSDYDDLFDDYEDYAHDFDDDEDDDDEYYGDYYGDDDYYDYYAEDVSDDE